MIIAQSLKEPCQGANINNVKDIQTIAVFGLESESALQLCEYKRRALVDLIENGQK